MTTTTDPEPDADEDQGAELDDTTAADAGDAEPVPRPDGEADPTYRGVVRGGPWNSRIIASRFPAGFVLVDKPHSRAWRYDYAAEVFTCRDPQPLTLDQQLLFVAGEGERWDVRVLDEEPEV